MPKSHRDLAKMIRKELRKPGRDRGRVTVRKTFSRLAPRVRLAFSTELSRVSSMPFRFRYAKGNSDRICTMESHVNP